MGWSKTTRISVMIAIDTVFFLVELISGFLVGSLALQADAFHMLNDIISLAVGLWAVKLARKDTTDKYSYGWLRAEILGAFFNAVFLIALCVSIILEAITRFIEPPEITNPELILIVGSFGLASNLVGFWVLGGHGHSHGPGDGHAHDEHDHDHDHEHAHGDEITAAEEGRSSTSNPADEEARIADLLPEAVVAQYQNAPDTESNRHISFVSTDNTRNASRSDSRASARSVGRQRRRANSQRKKLTSIDDMSIHPASFRNDIIAVSRPQEFDEETSAEDSLDETAVADDVGEHTPLLKGDETSNGLVAGHEGQGHSGQSHSHSRHRSVSRRARRGSTTHNRHHHNDPQKAAKGHGHSHGDMGMNAMVLHVIGDALGNIGVIITALVIWKTDIPGKFYTDPLVSLFITLIILKSALPLTKATSKILLQATPDHIDVNHIKEDIQDLEGVVSCHHVHIWQLSDTKIVASLHIQVAFPISAENGERYMDLAKRARKCLHAYGIHSATIQPEFCLDRAHDHQEDAVVHSNMDGTFGPSSECGASCLLECVDDCAAQKCCSPNGSPRPTSSHSTQSAGHEGHGHGHDHSH
ncbi:uncharacterized protein E0L32_009474 [Thyridium curvatum]|uniref:Uncharacterized protein n=1 Tax=Thyridium curvatum TaxID=1093900 RepID=A0A507AIX9_9PEZI|nr:uncharacterized protein E0L32_009474 [Thyridium curvatum]TPX09282.1 hypothetical protein E0L32_009474 [Thyridium curvatum]